MVLFDWLSPVWCFHLTNNVTSSRFFFFCPILRFVAMILNGLRNEVWCYSIEKGGLSNSVRCYTSRVEARWLMIGILDDSLSRWTTPDGLFCVYTFLFILRFTSTYEVVSTCKSSIFSRYLRHTSLRVQLCASMTVAASTSVAPQDCRVPTCLTISMYVSTYSAVLLCKKNLTGSTTNNQRNPFSLMYFS